MAAASQVDDAKKMNLPGLDLYIACAKCGKCPKCLTLLEAQRQRCLETDRLAKDVCAMIERVANGDIPSRDAAMRQSAEVVTMITTQTEVIASMLGCRECKLCTVCKRFLTQLGFDLARCLKAHTMSRNVLANLFGAK